MQSNPFAARTSRKPSPRSGRRVDGLRPRPAELFDCAGTAGFNPRGSRPQARPSPGPRRVAAHRFTFPEEAPPIGYRR